MPRERTVLVVEDNRDHALLVRIAARRALPAVDIRIAEDGHAAIAYLAGRAPFQDRDAHPFPQLVLLDLFMPDVDGFGVLEWMASEELLERVPVVVMTSSVNARDEERSLRLGAKAFHSKPSDLDELSRLVRSIVEHWAR